MLAGAEPARPAVPAELVSAEKPGLEPSVARTAASADPEPEPPPAAAAPAVKKPDLEARSWILFRVKDENGAPVAGAEVRLDGLRRKSERGSVYAWRGEPDRGTTDRDGTVRLPCPTWITLEDETASVVVFVHHPDFMTHENQDCLLQETVDIVLERGSVLVIAGWFGTKDRVVTDVKPRFSWDVDLKAEDWLPRRDGRLTTTRMKPGVHIVLLVWKSPDHGICFSELTPFQTVAGEDLELFLELKPGQTLKGRLGLEVPRPVIDGEVSVAVQFRSETGSAFLQRSDAPVNADGSFEVGNLAAGSAQIVGVCKGFAAVPAVEEAESGERRTAVHIDLRKIVGVYELRMEPTATLELELRGPDGEPARGVSVQAWPNVCWRVQACSSYAETRTWSGTSDADGRLRIEDIPAGEHSFGATHAELDFPAEGAHADRTRRAKFGSGETVRLSYGMEKKPDR